MKKQLPTYTTPPRYWIPFGSQTNPRDNGLSNIPHFNGDRIFVPFTATPPSSNCDRSSIAAEDSRTALPMNRTIYLILFFFFVCFVEDNSVASPSPHSPIQQDSQYPIPHIYHRTSLSQPSCIALHCNNATHTPTHHHTAPPPHHSSSTQNAQHPHFAHIDSALLSVSLSLSRLSLSTRLVHLRPCFRALPPPPSPTYLHNYTHSSLIPTIRQPPFLANPPLTARHILVPIHSPHLDRSRPHVPPSSHRPVTISYSFRYKSFRLSDLYFFL